MLYAMVNSMQKSKSRRQTFVYDSWNRPPSNYAFLAHKKICEIIAKEKEQTSAEIRHEQRVDELKLAAAI